MFHLQERSRRTWLIILAALAALALAVWTWMVIRVSEAQFVELSGHVNDTAQMVDLDYLNRIQRICIGLQSKTGIDVVLVSVETARPFATDEYAQRLVQRWGSAHREAKGVILLLIAKAEGRINIEVSRSVDFVLPKTIGSKILDDHVIPLLNKANEEAGNQIAGGEGQPVKKIIGKALHDGVVAIATRINELSRLDIFNEHLRSSREAQARFDQEQRGRWLAGLYALLIVLIILIAWGVRRLFTVRCSQCRTRVRPTEEVIEVPTKDRPGLSVRSYSCKKCGNSENRREVTWYRRFQVTRILNVLLDVWKTRSRRRRREKRKSKFFKTGR